AENTLTVVPGFLGAYPNAIFSIKPGDLPALAKAIGSMSSEDDYRKLADRYAVRRTNPRFWATSDELIDAYATWAPVEAGIFDYSRLENR
ncbi:MAG: fatty acid cis/trans isomerase, partial [Burkholderiaceae bacterium]